MQERQHDGCTWRIRYIHDRALPTYLESPNPELAITAIKGLDGLWYIYVLLFSCESSKRSRTRAARTRRGAMLARQVELLSDPCNRVY